LRNHSESRVAFYHKPIELFYLVLLLGLSNGCEGDWSVIVIGCEGVAVGGCYVFLIELIANKGSIVICSCMSLAPSPGLSKYFTG